MNTGLIIYVIVAGLVFWSLFGMLIYGIYSATSEIFKKQKTDEFCFLNPAWLYKSYKVNYFGCFLLTILFNIINPIGSIIYWVYKLCIIGRK